MNKKLAGFKKGIIPREERDQLAATWADEHIDIETLDPLIVATEAEAIAKQYERVNVPTLGYVPVDRPDGVVRFMYGQMNSMSSVEARDEKSEEILHLVRKYSVQGVAIAEHCTNFSYLPSSQGLSSWFSERTKVKASSSHNQHAPQTSRYLPGGTGLIAFHELIQSVRSTNNDFRGLGRWTSWRVYNDPRHVTRIVMAYSVGKSKPQGLKTTYQQQLHYIQTRNMDTNPRRMFETDLHAVLRVWRSQGERLLIFMDANEHVLTGKFCSRLLEDPSLHLQEATHSYWGATEPNTYVGGTDPIDTIMHSDDIEINNLMILPFSSSPGDHRSMICDISTFSMLGTYEYKIVYPECRRLSLQNHPSVKEYDRIYWKDMAYHRLEERLAYWDAQITEYPASTIQQQALEIIDRQHTEIQLHAERKCRKIMKPDMPYSLPVKFWHMRRRSYMELIKIKKGKVRNRSNVIKRAAKRGIPNPRQLTMLQLLDGVKYCKMRLHELRKKARGHRRVHLRDCLIRAKDANNEEDYKGVLRTITNEEGKKMWGWIGHATNDPKSGSVTKVERVVHGVKETYTKKEDMEICVQEEGMARFQLAHSAKITKSSLAWKLGFLSDTEIASQMLDGTYEIPDEVDDTTTIVLQEIARLGMELVAGNGEKIVITPAEFQYYWKGVKEKTNSSLSKVHFAHYKAAALSDRASAFMAKKITVIARCGSPPSRWGSGLQVMLEKIAGVALVNKLRFILLLEADYNFHSKWAFGHHALNALLESGYVPEEQFSQCESTADDCKMDERLQMDISRQYRQPMGSNSADASNCYDRISHIIMSYLLLAIVGGSWIGSIVCLLKPIQYMKFFQRTGYGDSSTFMGGPLVELLLQGLCQGNGAAPACWTMISSILIHCYKAAGHGAELIMPLTGELLRVLGNMYVDDTTLYTMAEHLRTSEDLFNEMQASLTCWSQLLNSTGGAHKPEKCWWYLVDYECVEGEWKYTDMVDWELLVTLPDDTTVPLQQLDVHTSQETLGVFSSPAGIDDDQHEKILKAVEKWTSRTHNAHFPAKYAWVSYRFKLWASIKYGIATMATPLKKAQQLLSTYHYRMLSFLGINRNVKKEWRTIPRAFGGVGLFCFSVEQTICALNMLIQHFGVPSTLGKKFRISLEILRLEIGTQGNPLTKDYAVYSPLATFCWYRSLWEKLWHYGFPVHLDFPDLTLPREGDVMMVELFLEAGYTGELLKSLNRCRLALQMLFLSDIVTADGRNVDRILLNPVRGDIDNSTYKFPREEPTDNDWTEWVMFWTRFTHHGLCLHEPLGKWVAPTHRRWRWYYDVANDVVEHLTPEGVDYYHKADSRRRTRSEQTYIRLRSDPAATVSGNPASVNRINDTSIRYLGFGPPFAVSATQPDDFWEYLYTWGGKWMWDGVEDPNQDLQWLVEGLKHGTLLCVTDGSYHRKLAPTVSGAGWVICCTSAHKMLRGNFYEISPSASSYRGELLGLVALHTLLLALSTFYEIPVVNARICCDNISALKQSSFRRRRVKNGASQADLLRALRTLKQNQSLKCLYRHVDAHQDRHKLWWQLTLEEQLNCVCDSLAKAAVSRSMETPLPRDIKQLLPLEKAAVFVNGIKLTTDVSKEVRFCLGESDARKFYTAPVKMKGGGLGWSTKRFEAVDWRALDKCLATKSDMYGMWLTKQSTGTCATRYNMARLQDLVDNKCPNCGMVEKATHLNRCPSEGRTQLLQESVETLEAWMEQDERTDEELRYYLPKYILFRGTRSMVSLGPMSLVMRKAAEDQDLIGWREFMEGKVAARIGGLQRYHCSISSCMMNGDDWMKHFVSHILHITHSQWIFRNITLHDKVRGTLRLQERQDVLEEVQKYLDTSPEDLPQESRFLVEFDFDALYRSSFEQQTYWVRAMKAARRAGRRVAANAAVARTRGRSARGVAVRAQTRPRLNTQAVEAQLAIGRPQQLTRGSRGSMDVRDAPNSKRARLDISEHRPHPAHMEAILPSNKSLRHPD